MSEINTTSWETRVQRDMAIVSNRQNTLDFQLQRSLITLHGATANIDATLQGIKTYEKKSFVTTSKQALFLLHN